MRTMRAWMSSIPLVALIVVGAACAPAGASGRWEALPAPPAPGTTAPVIDVDDIACGAPTSCLALPTRADVTGQRWGVRWDGATWTPIPSPADNVYELECIGDWCLAVSGPVGDQPTSRTWTWDGTAWSEHAAPDVVTYQLDCVNAAFCVAVAGDGEGSLAALRWDGAGWTTISDGRPWASAFRLAEVACVPDGSCRFIARKTDGSDANQLEQWAGGTWTVASVADDGGVVKAGTITCGSSATSCRVGATVAPATGAQWWGLLRWDGVRWVREVLPATSYVSPVVCAPDDTCMAVSSRRTLVLDGTTWRDAGPMPADATELTCASAQFCVQRVLRAWDTPATTPQSFRHWDGRAWRSVDAGPAPATADAGLVGVACPTETWCLGVGRYREGGADEALVERFDGTGWMLGPTLPAALAGAELRSVACTAREQCVVVGQRAGAPFLARLRGSAWTDESAAFAASAPGGVLNDIWCGGSTCIVVSPSGNTGLAFRSTDAGWSSMPAPVIPQAMPAPGRTNMQIDCASATSCAVTGVYVGSQAIASVSYWNGSTWSDPAATGGQLADAFLTGVACPAAGTCLATGLRGGRSVEGLVLTWDGSAWAPTTTPAPLGSVSCGAGRCVAAGDSAIGPGGLRGAVRVAGQWSPVAEPVPDVPGGRVAEVTCAPTGAVCVAVGGAAGAPFAYRWRF